MNTLESLLALLQRKQTQSTAEVPEGFCPNCWGREEYAGKFYEAVKNENVDVKSPNPNIGWVQDYANKHLVGIELQHEDDLLVCPKCKLTYRPT